MARVAHKIGDREDVIPCSHCAGEGEITLTGIYADTLAMLRLQEEEVTAVQLAALDGRNPTAMNNRLTALEGFGFATSRRYGRSRLYKATTQEQGNPE